MQPSRFVFPIACLLILLASLGHGQQQDDPQEDVAPRRPAAGRRPRQRQGANSNNNPGASVSGSMALTGPSLGAAIRPAVEGSADLELRPATGTATGPTPAPSGAVAGANNKPANAAPDEEELAEDGAEGAVAGPSQRPSRKPADRRRRPSKRPRRPPPPEEEEEPRYQDEEDELCRDDDYQHGDYGNLFESMAGGPMRQFGRLMKSAFGRGMSMGSAGDNMASASAFSSPGLSRMSSSVSNNGQTRGIVSETRNGRTRTRLFGDSADNEEADEDDY